MSCVEGWYHWHRSSFEVGILLNAEVPGNAPAALWNASPVPAHTGVVEVKPVAQAFKLAPLPSHLPAAAIARITRRQGSAAAGRREARYEQETRTFNTRHAGRTVWRVYAPGAVARRVGHAWLVVRGGSSARQRLRFLDGLRVTRLDLDHTS